MKRDRKFTEISYENHIVQMEAFANGGVKASHAKTWLQNDTIDAWRHRRMYEVLDPIIENDPQTKWLTVGDGRFGKDSKYITDKGCDALPTNISDTLLKEAKSKGYIEKYQIENAERISFDDNVFDYVLCKESYHHFPRPQVALYEMLRVAKKGVVLIEPNDPYVDPGFRGIVFQRFKSILKWFLKMKDEKHSFEQSGNYVYGLSRREVEKVSLGMNYSYTAFKGFNDFYFEGVEYEKFDENGRLQKKTKRKIIFFDILARFGLTSYGFIVAVIFKKVPSEKVLEGLKASGYDVIKLPVNPFVNICYNADGKK